MRPSLAAVTSAVVDFAPDPGRNGLPGERLLLINVTNLVIRTIWTTTPGWLHGPRLTRCEDVTNLAALQRRLRELVPLLCSPRVAAPAAIRL